MNLWQCLLGCALVVAISVGISHLQTCPEDSCVVWVCQVQGNGQC